MCPVTSTRIIYRACEKWSENGDSRLGAALSYYALFSTAPLLLIAIYIAGAVFGEDAANRRIREQLKSLMGEETAVAVEKMIETSAQDPPGTSQALAISIGLLLIGALGAFLHVRAALCMIWKLSPPTGNTWLGLLWDHFLALVMVCLVVVLLLISLACGFVIPILQKTMQEFSWQWLELASSFVFLTILFATMYRILSGGQVSWGYAVYGSIVASILFTIGKTLLGFYIVYSGTASMYGAAGSIVVFLVWVYYSSQILFFSAELIQARRTRHEWMSGAKPADER